MAVTLYTIGLPLNFIVKLFEVSTPAVLWWVRIFAEKHMRSLSPMKILWLNLMKCDTICIKKNKLWIWKAYCRATGQLIDWECGGRDQKTFKRLFYRLRRWNICFYFANHWSVYSEEIPENDLFQGKSGTVAIERNSDRQQHWVARFRRKSIVISKSLYMV